MTLRDQIQHVIDDEPVAIFMKGTPERPACGNSLRALQALWNAGPPSSEAFATPLVGQAARSGGAGGPYAGDQTGVLIPPGQSRTLWLKFWRPTSTVSTVPETIQILLQPRYP